MIEILVAFAIIGILSAVILVILSVSGKDRANQKSAYSSAKSAQARLLQCLNVDEGNISCGSGALYSYCRGQLGSNSSSVAAALICGIYSGGTFTAIPGAIWPALSGYGYKYGEAACSVKSRTAFNFAIYKTGANIGDNIFCCTQNGCSEIEIRGDYDMSSHVGTCYNTSDPLNKTLCECKKSAGLEGFVGPASLPFPCI